MTNELDGFDIPGSHLIDKLNHPVFNLISISIGILGIGLALFFGIKSSPTRKLVFAVSPTKTAIVKTGKTSILDVYVNNEKTISDVTAAQVVIWNGGKRSIEESDLLEPLTLYTEPPIPILEATIKNVSRELTKIRIDTNNLKKGTMPISWKILEKNDGCAIQLIYLGNTEVRFKIGGTIKEQGSPEIYKSETPGQTKILTLAITLMLGTALSALFTLYLQYRRSGSPRRRLYLKSSILTMAFILVLLLATYLSGILLSPTVPPIRFD